MSKELIKDIEMLIEKDYGDYARLTAILDAVKKGRKLYSADKSYVDNLVSKYLTLYERKIRHSEIQSRNKNTEYRDTRLGSEGLFCTKCGNQLDDTSKFCIKCGTRIENEKQDGFCIKCGTRMQSGHNFCTKCGSLLRINEEISDMVKSENIETMNTNSDKEEKLEHVVKTSSRSPMWYLLPIFFAIIGGLISYAVIKKQDRKMAKNCLLIGIILTVIPIIATASFYLAFGIENPFYVVSSGSMIPNLNIFDLIIVQGHVNFDQLKVGDIIVFNRPDGHDKVIVHRVAEILNTDPLVIRTKGDANPGSIPGTDFPITKEDYIGKVVYVIPQIGYVTRILTPPLNYIMMIMIILPIIAAISAHKKYKESKDHT